MSGNARCPASESQQVGWATKSDMSNFQVLFKVSFFNLCIRTIALQEFDQTLCVCCLLIIRFQVYCCCMRFAFNRVDCSDMNNNPIVINKLIFYMRSPVAAFQCDINRILIEKGSGFVVYRPNMLQIRFGYEALQKSHLNHKPGENTLPSVPGIGSTTFRAPASRSSQGRPGNSFVPTFRP
jgi:hypothetical protein